MPQLVELPDSIADVFPGVGCYCWDVAADTLYWSKGLLKLYRLSAPPHGEHGFYGLLHHEDRVRVQAETTAFLEAGDTYDHCFRIICPDGSVRTIIDRGVIERHADGTAKLLRGINIDVTDEQAVRAVIPQPESTFQLLADNIDQLAWIANASGWIHWYNKRWLDYTGYSLEEMAGWGWRKAHHPDHVDRVVAKITACFESGEPWQDEFPLRSKSGEYRWFLSRALPVRDEQGEILLWFGTNTDITEKRRSEAHFSALAESVPQLVWTSSPDGQVDYYNSRIANYSTAKDPGTGKWAWPLLLHPDDLAGTVRAWQAAVATGEDYSYSHRLRMTNGSYRWHISRGVAAKDADGQVERWFGTATDIHELKEADLFREVLLQESNHRIKNIMTVIRSLAQLSARGSQRDGRYDVFVQRLDALAKAHSLTMRGQDSAAQLFDLIDSVTTACGVPPERLVREGDNATTTAPAAQMIALALHELCTNAMKYGALSTSSGQVTIVAEELSSGRARILWREAGGPEVTQPTTRGLGSRLIEQALAQAIAGTASLKFQPAGLICVIEGDLKRDAR